MLVQQSNPATPLPLTPVSTPPGHASDLSPRSSNSSYVSNDSMLNQSSLHSANKDNTRGMNSPENFSALQRLQFALERNALFSTLLNEHNESQSSRLVKPCQSSSSSSVPDSPEEKHHITGSLTNGIRTPASSPDDSTNTTNIIFQCPLCSVVCSSRHDFNEHLVTHSQQHACPRCPFLTDNEDSLRSHLLESHDVSEFEVLTDDEVRTPKTNSQGKTKMFKCKQCGYSAVTKMDFWEHTKTHIRQEKMLTCPKCPFVTEYKHHLEYHLRNHFGSKPFQCNKCAYSCVNKSMLNSHLKSHSSIYQYRCADCSYATKYCHSLKLHLRKYDHKPSMVLNPDGTPNPLPIIDVYGTRRGPKIKRQQDKTGDETSSEPASPTFKEKTQKKQKTLKRQTVTNEINNHGASNNNCSTPPVSPQFPVYEIKQEYGSPNMFSPTHPRMDQSPKNIDNGIRNNIHFQHVQPTMQMPLASVNPAAAFQLQNLIMQNTANKSAMEMMMKNPMEAYAAALNHYMLSNQAIHVTSPLELTKMAEEQQRVKMFSQILHQTAMGTHPQISHVPDVPKQVAEPEPINLNIQTPLDLRNPKTGENHHAQEDIKKRKRKGKALKYDRRKEVKCEVEDEDSNEVLDFSNNNNSNKMPNLDNRKELENESLICKYCDISFPPVLYSLHMRFHSSDSEPFRCNVCGAGSTDKVSFFVHLATASH